MPWYTSIEQQNARKWWIYNRVYPLFTPATFLLPFQLIRVHRGQWLPDGEALQPTETGVGAVAFDGSILTEGEFSDYVYADYNITGIHNLYFDYLPKPFMHDDIQPIPAIVADSVELDENISRLIPDFGVVDHWSGAWELENSPVYGYPKFLRVSTGSGDVGEPLRGIYRAKMVATPIVSFEIYTKDGTLVDSFDPDNIGIQIVAFPSRGYDVITFPGQFPITPSMPNGQYYAVMSDGVETWYSEIFTVVNDIQPYLKIEWWDNEDFVMDAGTIVYKNPAFKNVLYLQSDLAKPEYPFEEEGETRDGYFFPTKQISEKRYRFNFLASEYLLDVMRFIRMADFAEIEYHGQRYSLDTFLITPEWEDNGDVAAVEAVFDTATVAKKIGVGYIKSQRGDFNDDFNSDYNNE